MTRNLDQSELEEGRRYNIRYVMIARHWCQIIEELPDDLPEVEDEQEGEDK